MPPEVLDALAVDGFATLAATPDSRAWAAAAKAAGDRMLADPEARARWLRHGGTWFVGVDALPTDGQGAIDGVPLPLGDWLLRCSGQSALHRAQLSVTFPGYPARASDESDKAYAFKTKRGAAHVDGLLRRATGGRVLAEPHAVVLGVGLTDSPKGASPLMVWPGSHVTMGTALRRVLPADPEDWAQTDVAGPYAAARRSVFAAVTPVPVALGPGETVILHRHLLHGIQPWTAQAGGAEEGRMTAYLRPEFTDPLLWLA